MVLKTNRIWWSSSTRTLPKQPKSKNAYEVWLKVEATGACKWHMFLA